MTFQPGSRDFAGGVQYDDAALQLLLLRGAPNNIYPGSVDYLQQASSSTPYRLLEPDYGKVYAQTFSEDPSLQPPLGLDTGQQKLPYDFASVLEELRQGISSTQTKCGNLEATVSELRDLYALHQAHSQMSLTEMVG
jgi:hypothetical protein